MKYFWVKKNFGPKKMLDQKNLISKNSWSKRNCGSKQIFGPDDLGPKKCCSQKFWHFPDTLFITSRHSLYTQSETFQKPSRHPTSNLQTPVNGSTQILVVDTFPDPVSHFGFCRLCVSVFLYLEKNAWKSQFSNLQTFSFWCKCDILYFEYTSWA